MKWQWMSVIMSQPQIGDLQPLVIEQVPARSLHDDPSVFEHIGTVCDLQNVMHILLDNQDGVLLVAEVSNRLKEKDERGRGQPRGGVSETQHPWPGHGR